MRVGGRAALGFLSGCVVVAGCSAGGSGDPVTLPPTTAASTTETTAPSTTAPPPTTDDATPTPTTTLILPDEHVESVDTFVADFFTALNAAKDTGDFTQYDALYLPQCTGCIELRDELNGWLANGGTVDGGDWVILQQSSDALQDDTRGGASAFVYRTAMAIGTPDNEIVAARPAGPIQWFQFTLLGGDQWIIEGMGSEEL